MRGRNPTLSAHAADIVDVFRNMSLSDGEEEECGSAASQPPIAVEMDISKYVGAWFQMYASLGPKYTFELGGRNVTAFYAPTTRPGVISVLNQTKPTRLLPSVQAKGFAVQSKEHSGILHVSFNAKTEANARFEEPGNYWVLGIGPVINGLYDWAVVSDSVKSSVYILTRDMLRFEKRYEKAILAFVESIGFTKESNKPRKTTYR